MSTKSKRKYLQYLNPLELLQTKKILQSNPTITEKKSTLQESQLSLYSYNEGHCDIQEHASVEHILHLTKKANMNHWLNLDIINSETVEGIASKLGLHNLLIEDILNVHQRPKIDEFEDAFSMVMQMLYFNEQKGTIESEQVSFVLKNGLLLSFQDDAARDLFNAIRARLKTTGSKLRNSGTDALLYALVDAIVDHYFIVLEKVGHLIEKLEEEITSEMQDHYMMNRIYTLRKELIFFKRNVEPVREMINNILRTDNPMITDNRKKYFKDIYDNTLHVNDLTENYRDIINSIRDLYLSQMNLKMNEVMKFLAIVTTLLAPATVIGGIFGMNFDKIPYLHHQNGFWIASIFMILIPVIMLVYFRRKGWF
ncbi:MAG TPA: magnesium and cobalt transport protein CorA [Chitinophagaceae bacterium]|nr:magnesium and cobalt transport protein CorA [Chitinophagaceae bacterium]